MNKSMKITVAIFLLGGMTVFYYSYKRSLPDSTGKRNLQFSESRNHIQGENSYRSSQRDKKRMAKTADLKKAKENISRLIADAMPFGEAEEADAETKLNEIKNIIGSVDPSRLSDLFFSPPNMVFDEDVTTSFPANMSDIMASLFVNSLILEKWGESHWDEAWDYVSTLNPVKGTGEKEEYMSTLLWINAKNSPREAAKAMEIAREKTPLDKPGKRQLIKNLFEKWTVEAPTEAWLWLESAEPDADVMVEHFIGSLRTSSLSALAKTDYDETLILVKRMPEGESRDFALKYLTKNYAPDPHQSK
ncbi:MAG: hypothetical protein AB8F34_06775 [Akkermansiaceae bacterium]